MGILFFSLCPIFPEGMRRVRIVYKEELLSWSSKNEIPSLISPFRSDVDDGISIGDDVEIMFDHDDTISLLYQSIEDIEEFLHIREVESSCRLIEDIESLSG